MLKKLEERSNMVSRDTDDIKATQVELLGMKTIVPEVENRQCGMNDRLDTVEENSKIKDLTIETIQTHCREKSNSKREQSIIPAT